MQGLQEMNGMKASVIIPAYNAEKTIQACLAALQRQSVKPIEVIVVDDGSKDGTIRVAKSFKEVRVLEQQHAGPAKARNWGSSVSKGDILVFTDSDCVAERNWLEEMLKPFENSQVIGVQGAYKTKQQSAVARFVQLEIEERYERMKRSKQLDWIGSYAAAYRKKQFLELGGFDESFPTSSGEDPALSYSMAEKGTLAFNPKAVVYHQHPETIAKYFRVKFYRAYWRTLLYKRFPKKMAADSFTPQWLKAQIGIVYGMVLLAIASVWIPSAIAWFWIALALFLASPIGLTALVASRDKEIAWLAPVMIYSRSIAFALGLPWGLLDGAWRH